MAEPVIITVAITGSVPRKADNPAVPVTPAEQVESTHAAFEAGASVVHIHVRDDEERPSSDPARFAAVMEGVRRHCPGMVVQFSTGGRGRGHHERLAPLALGPEMASFATGSVNFPTAVYENPPDFVDELADLLIERDIKPEIEVFDASMLYVAHRLAQEGRLRRPLHVQFVHGIRNAMPARRALFDFLVDELTVLEPDATWGAAGLGRHQLEINRWCLERGGHCRTGLEDNVRFDAGRLATGNAELVARLAALCAEHGRSPATVCETRALLGLAVVGS